MFPRNFRHVILKACHHNMTAPTEHLSYHCLVFNQWRLPWRKRPAAVSNIHTVKWWFRGPQRRTFNVSAPLTFTPHQTSQHAVISDAQLSPRREREFPSNVKPSVTSHFLNCTRRFLFLNLSNVHQGMWLCKPFLLHKLRLRRSATSTKGPFRRA